MANPLKITRSTGVVSMPLLVAGTTALAASAAAVRVGYSVSTGQVGITLSPNADGGYALAFFNAAATLVGSITTSATATAFNTSSDARLKTDLQPFDAGPILDAISAYNFAWIANGERAHGVIAQEVDQVYPEAVTHNDNDDAWGIDYSRFVPLLLQEIKTLRARVAALETAAI